MSYLPDPVQQIVDEAVNRHPPDSILRNAGAAAVLAVFAIDPAAKASAWRQSDFLALGFRSVEGTRTQAPGHLIYRYDIHDYKITPNWLNSGYWANPNRWDHERW